MWDTMKSSEITPYISSLADLARGEGAISADLYEKYKVNRGLRDLNGKGVLTGLTEISEVKSSEERDGVSVPCEGKLYYRGYDVNDLVPRLCRRRPLRIRGMRLPSPFRRASE